MIPSMVIIVLAWGVGNGPSAVILEMHSKHPNMEACQTEAAELRKVYRGRPIACIALPSSEWTNS